MTSPAPVPPATLRAARAVAGAGLLLALAATACAPTGPPPDAPLSDRFQARLEAIVDDLDAPGATAAYALADGTVAAFAAGLADREAGTPMPPDAIMPAGSVGKSFVAAVAVALAQEGRLDLDRPIAEWLGDEPWFGELPNARVITARQLLTHSSGLSDHYRDPGLVEMIAAGRASGDPDWAITPVDAVRLIADDPPLFPPGEGFAYTDTGYLLVGLILEKVAGEPYSAQVRERFLEPLQLHLTTPSDRREIPGLVPGYVTGGDELGLPRKTAENGVMVFSPASEWTGGGLASNPADLVRWAKALYEGGAISGPSLDELLTSVPWGDAEGVRYGLGVIISETPLGVRYGHSGWFPGYVSDVRYYPEHGVAVAIQVNQDEDRGTGAWVTALADEVLR